MTREAAAACAVDDTHPVRHDVRDLLALLTLEAEGDDAFSPTYYPDPAADFVFGGQFLAQSLVAASATVPPDRLPHSLHGHFFAAGRPDRPLTYRVVRLRDGGSFSARRVEADQDGSMVFAATASFNKMRDSAGYAEYQLPPPDDTPHPGDDRYPWTSVMQHGYVFPCFELREIRPAPPGPDGRRRFSRRVWFRTVERLPDSPLLHSCLLAFASDFGVTVAASATAGLYERATVLSSLDHALWLHRPARVDEWTLLDLVSVSNTRSRGLVKGMMHALGGELVGSVAQETLIR
jgi:acyl-CoA thioesterase-2